MPETGADLGPNHARFLLAGEDDGGRECDWEHAQWDHYSFENEIVFHARTALPSTSLEGSRCRRCSILNMASGEERVVAIATNFADNF